MRKRLIFMLVVVLAVAVTGVAAASEKPIVVRSGNLILTLNGEASPRTLPKFKQAPVTLRASGHIATADGTHPPALKEVLLDVAKKGETGEIRADRFPVCKQREIEVTTTKTAESKCRDAIVGSGRTKVEVQFEESQPFTAAGPLIVFNGGVKNGKTLILIHAYVSVPAPTAIVTQIVTTEGHRPMNPYRIHSVAKIPVVAGGAGSLIGFSLKIDRKGYLVASCGVGTFAARATAKFRDGSEMSGTFVRPCTGI